MLYWIIAATWPRPIYTNLWPLLIKPIADMLVHSAYTYIHWLVKFDSGVDVPKYQIEDTKKLFKNEKLVIARYEAIS